MVSDVSRFMWDVLKFRPDAVHLDTSGHLAFRAGHSHDPSSQAASCPRRLQPPFRADCPTSPRRVRVEWKWARRALKRANVVLALDERTAKA